ncbi:unnamed protein product [Spirodela intermedia]|uniref:Uncharacterized protein n=1 Tax=Spirodela intermedia TaxID=51605 RepID=A0A7I8ISG6_SPIIN|nr:unnamed protein product [Spirodela intermedia]CAA6660469.1 unnamed protein product [Spirodela intermedia]
MAAAALWQPQEEGLREICGLLEQHISRLPINNGKSVEIRQAAGLLLKNNMKTAFTAIAPSYQQYIKSELLPCLGAAERHIRSTVGTVISVIVQQGRIFSWPELLQALLNCLDSNDLNHMEISEDIPEELDADVPGLVERPINIFMPRLLQFFQSPHATLRKLSLASINQYIVAMPTALFISMDQYLQGLFLLANDPVPDVRKLVCAALVQLIEVRPNFLEPHLRNVIDYMLRANKDADEEVALEACEFWSAFCDANIPPEALREFFPRLIPVLLSNMAYADDDEALVDAEDDESVPDRDEDLKPRFHTSRFHASENSEEDDDEPVNVWNLRKCSAAGLDILSNVFGDEILPTLMPLVETKLATSGDLAWKDREAAVLALGAVAEGCIKGLYPHLPGIIAFLIPLLDDKFPLIRSITCWTLSRYSKFIVQEYIGHQGIQEQFDKVLMGILRRILDTNKRVQEAACSAFATLEEEAAEELAPRLEIILQHLLCAFGKYQRRNLRIVYDAIGTLADAVGAELNQPRYLDILMPPLISKWQQLANCDKDLFPLLECFISIVQALGPGFSQYAEFAFKKCVSDKIFLSRSILLLRGHYDKDFIVYSLDLLSGLVEGLGGGIESLLAICLDNVGTLSFYAGTRELGLNFVLRENYSILRGLYNLDTCLLLGWPGSSPIVLNVILNLVRILQNAEGLNKSLIENSAITLGRLAWVCPELVAPHMEHFMQCWCSALCTEDAFRGLCAMVRSNPSGAMNSLAILFKAVASWHEIRSEDLHNEVSQVLNGYKQMLGNATWEHYMSMLDTKARERLAKYGV